jgi:hypothetical protein
MVTADHCPAVIGVKVANEFIECRALNGIFVLGRSMGFIGHFIVLKRPKAKFLLALITYNFKLKLMSFWYIIKLKIKFNAY